MKLIGIAKLSGVTLVAATIGLWAATTPTSPSSAAEEDHAGHAVHADEPSREAAGEHEEGEIDISAADIRRHGIEIAVAGAGSIDRTLEVSGEVQLNPDRVAHIVARVPGVAREVHATIGDRVRIGQVLAVFESREFASAKAEFLAAKAREALSRELLEREEALWRQEIVPEQEYLRARQEFVEAQIARRLTRRALHALGVDEADLGTVEEQDDMELWRYVARSPLSGIVTERHLARGEMVDTGTQVFVVADLSNVWVDLAVHQGDLADVEAGQRIAIRSESGRTQAGGPVRADGLIGYVSPIVDEDTRTATARVILGNPDGTWRPGMFVGGTIAVDSDSVSILVPTSAVQNVEGRVSVFVRTGHGFEARPVELGRASSEHVEVVDGLHVGERYAAGGTFTLKAELGKGELDSGHNH